MGFTPQRITYALQFDTDELKGLEVEVRSVSLAEYLKVTAARRLSNASGREWTDEDRNAMADLYDAFAGALVAWNVEDEAGAPVPADRDGVYAQDLAFLVPVALAWLNAMGGGATDDGDLGKDSSSGERFPEASLPMALPSPSPQS